MTILRILFAVTGLQSLTGSTSPVGWSPAPQGQGLTVLTEGSSPAWAAGTGTTDVVTGGSMVTLTLVLTAQPKPPFRAL